MYKEHFWLIQRGSFRDLDNPQFFGGSAGHLIDPDYMGSAEFEFGAIPKAFRRLMGHFGEYDLRVLDITNPNGVPFCLFCKKDRYSDILAELKNYISNRYQLKEYSGIHAHLPGSTEDAWLRRTNFWWCIDYPSSIGDWVLFLGGRDRQKALINSLNHDYLEWWMKKSEEERAKELEQANRRW